MISSLIFAIVSGGGSSFETLKALNFFSQKRDQIINWKIFLCLTLTLLRSSCSSIASLCNNFVKIGDGAVASEISVAELCFIESIGIVL